MKKPNVQVSIRLLLAVLACSVSAPGWQSVYYRMLSTPSLRIKYEKNVTRHDAQKIGTLLDSAAANLGKKLNMSFHHTIDVLLFKSPDRLQKEAGSKFFNDGTFRNGKIYVAIIKESNDGAQTRDAISRLVARALLSQIPDCPAWLAEA